MRRAINPESLPKLPFYSQGIETSGVSRMLFVSGQVGAGPTGEVPPGLAEQARLAMANVHNVLAEAGMDSSNVVKLNIYLAEGADFGEFMTSGLKVPEIPPATTLLVVKGMSNPALKVEIEAIAVA